MIFKSLKKCDETCQRIVGITMIILMGLFSLGGILRLLIAIAEYQ